MIPEDLEGMFYRGELRWLEYNEPGKLRMIIKGKIPESIDWGLIWLLSKTSVHGLR